jgi:hypothetical protein
LEVFVDGGGDMIVCCGGQSSSRDEAGLGCGTAAFERRCAIGVEARSFVAGGGVGVAAGRSERAMFKRSSSEVAG